MIIPQPKKLDLKEGNFILDENTVVFATNKVKSVAEFFASELRLSTGLKLPIENSASDKNQISLELVQNKNLGDEGYELNSTTDGIKITAEKPVGLFYGCQSLRQLLPPENLSQNNVHNI